MTIWSRFEMENWNYSPWLSEHQAPSEPEELEGEEFTTAEDKLLALFRRIATPFKRVNKVKRVQLNYWINGEFLWCVIPQRLMTMESLQDKIESEISKIKIGIETNNDDLVRRLSEFILSSNDISTEQNRLIENYASNFASLGKNFCLHGLYFSSKLFILIAVLQLLKSGIL